MPTPRVMLMCTANICRSPSAERLFATMIGPQIDFFSRGMRAVPGARICGVSGNWLAARGAFGVGAGSAVAHRSQQVDVEDVAGSALILTASQRHKAIVNELEAGAHERTYTLLEAARIVRWMAQQGLNPAVGSVAYRLAWLREALAENQAAVPPADPPPHRSRLHRKVIPVVNVDSLADPHEVAVPHPELLLALENAVRTICVVLYEPNGRTGPLHIG